MNTEKAIKLLDRTIDQTYELYEGDYDKVNMWLYGAEGESEAVDYLHNNLDEYRLAVFNSHRTQIQNAITTILDSTRAVQDTLKALDKKMKGEANGEAN